MAQAQQNVAQTQLQQQTRANQAWNQVGETAQQLGNNLLSLVDTKVRLDMANAVQDWRGKQQEHLMGLAQRAERGEIKSGDIAGEMAKFNDSYKEPDISGMSPLGRVRLQNAIKETNSDFHSRATQLADETLKVETSNGLDKNIESIKKNGFDAGESPAVTAAKLDEPGLQQSILLVHGGNASAYTRQAKGDVYKSYNVRALNANLDNYNGLTTLIHKWNDPNDPDSAGLDPDTKMQLINQASNRKESLEAQARAKAEQAQRQQEHREAVADKLLTTILETTASTGIPPSKLVLDKLEQVSAGTSRGKGVAVNMVLQTVKQVQTLASLTPEQQQQWRDQKLADFQKNGYNNPEEIEMYNRVSKSLDTASAEYKRDPLTATAQQQLKTPPAPMPEATLRRVLDGKGTLDDNIELQNWKNDREALYDMAKKRDPSLTKTLLTAPDAGRLKTIRDSLKTPEERLQFDTTLAGIDPTIVKQVGGTDEDATAARMKHVSPANPAPDYIVKGKALREDKNTIYKPTDKAAKGLQGDFSKVAPYIAPSSQTTSYTAAENHYIGWAASTGKTGAMQNFDSSGKSVAATVGTLATYGNGKVLVPPNEDGTQYVNRLVGGIRTIPIDGPVIEENLKAGTIRLVRTAGGLQVMQAGGGPFWGHDGKSIIIPGY